MRIHCVSAGQPRCPVERSTECTRCIKHPVYCTEYTLSTKHRGPNADKMIKFMPVWSSVWLDEPPGRSVAVSILCAHLVRLGSKHAEQTKTIVGQNGLAARCHLMAHRLIANLSVNKGSLSTLSRRLSQGQTGLLNLKFLNQISQALKRISRLIDYNR